MEVSIAEKNYQLGTIYVYQKYETSCYQFSGGENQRFF